MAKELPYYKHEPSEWLEGEIQICSDAAIVCFSNLRDGYWLKLGCISYAFALHKYCRKDASILQELIDNGIVDLEGDDIVIKFLDNQLKEFNDVSEKRKQAAEKRWKNKPLDANALQVESKSNAIREDKSKEDNIREDNIREDKKEVPKITFSDSIYKTYETILSYFDVELRPKTDKSKESWLDTIDKLNRIDMLTFDEIELIVRETRKDNFWSVNFQSLTKLRKKDKDQIYYWIRFKNILKSKQQNNGQTKQSNGVSPDELREIIERHHGPNATD